MEGPNVLPERKMPGPLRIFLNQFKSPFIYVLLVAAVVSWGLGQVINSYFILAVLILNALIGAAQEYSAARAAAALRRMVPYRATALSVFRQGLLGNRFLLLAILGAQAIHIGSMYTPGLRDLLQVMPVTPDQWTQLLMVALILIVMDEAHKFLLTRHTARSMR